MNGILLIRKDTGVTSTSCVNHVRKCLKNKFKVGHAGTLDSTASGLLVILIGKATRLSSYIMELPKWYRTTVKLGAFTETDDYSGEVIASYENADVSDALIDTVLFSFQGTRKQVPPRISAVRINGKRAHMLTRRGENFSLRSKPIYVEYIRRTSPLNKTMEFQMEIKCHKGTYIRSIVRDLGMLLGSGAFVRSLERTSIGLWSLDHPFILRLSSCMGNEEIEDHLLSLEEMQQYYNTYSLSCEQEHNARNGSSLILSELSPLARGLFPSARKILLRGNNLLSFARITEDENLSSFAVNPETNICLSEDFK
ncbi:MAG TPA: tRNA pseudouridine(55) synthase TruB [Synergistales bacterium]|nr:tRNA pseudouridine(55) synthase TruB [Synergistales bacterium]